MSFRSQTNFNYAYDSKAQKLIISKIPITKLQTKELTEHLKSH